MNRKFALVPVALFLSTIAADATIFDFTGPGNLWNDASNWAARETTTDTVPTTTTPPAMHSASLGGTGRTLYFSPSATYYLDNLSLDHTGTYVLRNLNEGSGTSNAITLDIAGDLTNGSGRLNFTNNTNGSMNVHVAGDVVLNGGSRPRKDFSVNSSGEMGEVYAAWSWESGFMLR